MVSKPRVEEIAILLSRFVTTRPPDFLKSMASGCYRKGVLVGNDLGFSSEIRAAHLIRMILCPNIASLPEWGE